MKYFHYILILFIVSCKKDIETIQLVKDPITVADTTNIKTPSIFNGYVVDLNAKLLGSNYWKNNIVLPDLVTIAFQTPLGNRNRYGTFLMGLTTGDFNNDGYVDVFNGGALFPHPRYPYSR